MLDKEQCSARSSVMQCSSAYKEQLEGSSGTRVMQCREQCSSRCSKDQRVVAEKAEVEDFHKV